MIDEKDQVDDLVSKRGRAPESLQTRSCGGVLEVEESGLQRREPSGGQQSHHQGSCFVGRDGRPMVHPQFLGLMVNPEDAPSAGFV